MNIDVKKNILKLIKEDRGIGKRLQSVRLPRDLSLGGTKTQKKKIAPNVNAIRDKDKAKEFLKNNENKGVERYIVRKQNNKPKDDNHRFVQSSGIFSEGIGSDIVKASRWSDRRSDKENDGGSGPPAMTMPTFNKKSYEIDKKTEDRVLDGIMGCEEDSEDEKLPFEPISWHKHYQEVPVKQEIKKESFDESGLTPGLNNLKLESRDPYRDVKEYTENDCLNNDNPSMSLWSLPHSFAGKGLSDDPNCKTLFDYSLKDMLEGQIGKLVIRKSGKMEVHIGRIKYNLEPSDIESCREEIVSLDADSNSQMTAAVLGQVQNGYSLYPDWDTLLKLN